MKNSPRPPKVREPDYAWGDCPAGTPRVRWEAEGQPLWAQVTPDGERILLLERGRVSLRSIAAGEVLWRQDLPELPDDLVLDAAGFYLAAGRTLLDLLPESGAVRARHRLGSPPVALALDPRTVYVATEGPLLALDRASGRQRWRAPCGEQPELQAHPDAGILILDETESESLVGYDTTTGARLWEHTAEGEPQVAGPRVGAVLVVSSYAGGASGLDIRSGEEQWHLETGRSFESAAVVLDRRAFLTDGAVYCVDPERGEALWQQELQDEEDGIFSLRTAGDLILAETWRGRLLALRPQDGSVAWESAPGQVQGAAAGHGRIYLRVTEEREGKSTWRVVALERATGVLAWELRSRRMVADVTAAGSFLVVELKNHVVVMEAGS